MEVFIYAIPINICLRSITSWEPVHWLPIDLLTSISLIFLFVSFLLSLVLTSSIHFLLLWNWYSLFSREQLVRLAVRLKNATHSISFVLLFLSQALQQGDAQHCTNIIKTTQPVISTAVNISWTSSFPRWHGNNSQYVKLTALLGSYGSLAPISFTAATHIVRNHSGVNKYLSI